MALDPALEQEVELLHERICAGFADPKRVLMLYALAEQDMCVSELAEALGISQSSASRHLRILRERGLARPERRGSSVYYSLADTRLIEALDLLRGVLASQLAAAADLARTIC